MIEIFRNRTSIRNYQNKNVSEKDLEIIKEAIRLAPTWKNKQCFEVVLLQDKELIYEVGKVVKFNPCENAYTNTNVVMVFVADPSKSGNRDEKPYYMADCAVAIEHACLCATSLGLGSCWVGVFPEEDIKKLLNIPSHLRVVALLPIGHVEGDIVHRPRRSNEEIFHINKY